MLFKRKKSIPHTIKESDLDDYIDYESDELDDTSILEQKPNVESQARIDTELLKIQITEKINRYNSAYKK